MSPEAQRNAIAEACGRRMDRPDTGWHDLGCDCRECYPHPNYLYDLNAMAQAFNTLPKSAHIAYGRHLQEICNEGLVGYVPCYPEDFAGLARIAYATAAQRAEAFLKTLNLWTE